MTTGIKNRIALTGALICALAVAACSGDKDTADADAVDLSKRAQLEAYDETADPYTQLTMAMDEARESNRQVLMVFGADWCPDCRILSAEFETDPLKSLIDERYVVEKIHVGRKDANVDFTDKFGDPAKNGIPSIVLLDRVGNVIKQTDAGELSTVRKMSSDEIYAWFEALPAG